MSLFRFARASSLIYLAGRYRERLYFLLTVLLIALATAWLYEDVSVYLQREHPHLEIYALAAKTIIVYGALIIVLWVLRPRSGTVHNPPESPVLQSESRLEQLADRERLVSRYEAILSGREKAEEGAQNTVTKVPEGNDS